ncbi:MAG: GAF domain-containing protein [candidate division NC10 bacterium]|nr:GAF domain-containing protein [candidate division NC10 bacterium]
MATEKSQESSGELARLREQVNKYAILLDIVRVMNAETNLDRLLELIMQEATRVVEAERSTLFLLDQERGELWSKVAQGLERQTIRLKVGSGIAGYVAEKRESVNIPDAYQDPRFNRETDEKTGYRTRTILCMPVHHKGGGIIGVLQVLNKKGGTFTKEDEGLLAILCSQAAIALENAQLYERLRAAYQELKELDQMKTDFLANISHELRTPLAPIIGYVDLLLSEHPGPLTARQQSGLEIISESVRRLRGLIEQLLTFVQLGQGGGYLQLKEASIDSLLRAKVEAFQEKARAKELSLTLAAPASLPNVIADPEGIAQVLDLLLDNAVKFTPYGGRICLAAGVVTGRPFQASPKEGRQPFATGVEDVELVEISVSDTGIGIPEDQLEKIFQHFYQVDSSSTRQYGGTGLGLALAKKIVEGHGSRIQVESRVGQGSTFRFFLRTVSPPSASDA